jgi:hypothetical protein
LFLGSSGGTSLVLYSSGGKNSLYSVVLEQLFYVFLAVPEQFFLGSGQFGRHFYFSPTVLEAIFLVFNSSGGNFLVYCSSKGTFLFLCSFEGTFPCLLTVLQF